MAFPSPLSWQLHFQLLCFLGTSQLWPYTTLLLVKTTTLFPSKQHMFRLLDTIRVCTAFTLDWHFRSEGRLEIKAQCFWRGGEELKITALTPWCALVELEKWGSLLQDQAPEREKGVRGLYMYACVFLKVFFISVAACWGESGHCAPRQLQTHTFQCVQSFHFVNWKQWIWAWDVHQRGREFSLYISPLTRKTKDVLLGPVFIVCISYSYQAPICPSLWLPQSQATGNEVLVWPEGGKKRAFVSPL